VPASRDVITEVDAAALVDHLVGLAVRGLGGMHVPETHEFVQTTRGVAGTEGPHLVPEGRNLRYAAICALGLAQVDTDAQHEVLGAGVHDLVDAVVARAGDHPDPGAVALAAWAAAEVGHRVPEDLLARLDRWLASGEPLHTVDVAWMLTATVACGADDVAERIAAATAERLLDAQGPGATYPHGIPAASQGRLRAHVGSFADQVYPAQALARYAGAGGGAEALAAADRTVDRLCELQGPAGQWWWHYDARDGSVVEGYPVYSVHQHAMAPMTLLDVAGAGGHDHGDAALLGLSWLRTHPETFGELVDDRHDVVWRKVGRREPRKAVRSVNAVTTAIRPGVKTPGMDLAFPPGPIDRECRPYELGWLLYAWCRPSGRALLSPPAPGESG